MSDEKMPKDTSTPLSNQENEKVTPDNETTSEKESVAPVETEKVETEEKVASDIVAEETTPTTADLDEIEIEDEEEVAS